MLKLAALATVALTAAASATPGSSLVSTAPWWEKITVTMTGEGSPQSCRYESSMKASDSCDVTTSSGSVVEASSGGSADQYTRITFERRFSPGAAKPDVGDLHPGDTFLGGQIMALAIDSNGTVRGCDVIATSGKMKPDYGCEEAAAERFDASLGGGREKPRQGYMTILVYGRTEQVA